MNNERHMGRKKLNVWDATSIVIGVVIGSGIFLVPSNIAAAVGTPAALILVWIVAGVLSLFGALSYAELGALFPQAGGQYAYLKEAYGALWGFLYGWSLFWVAQSGSIAAVAVGFATYLGYFVPSHGTLVEFAWPVQIAITENQLWAAGLVAVLTAVNYIGLKYGALVQNAFTLMKSLACLAIVFLGCAGGARPIASFFAGGSAPSGALAFTSAFGVALVAALWALDGWNNVTFISGEAQSPRRTIPLALLLGTAGIVAIYLLMNVAYLRVLDIGQIASSERIAADAMQTVIGGRGASLIAVFILISTFGCVNGMILAAARVYQAQAEDGLFPRRMAEIHPRFATPGFALVTQGIWSALLALSGRYDQLFTFAIFALWIFYGMSVAAIFIFRRRGLQAAGYRVWAYPVVPGLFVLLCAGLLVNTLIETPWESLIGTGLILAGLPAYYWYARRKPDDRHERR
ncbi:MAG: amino acid permease [Acidobacteria bacterium]|nr:amino acid permease [Acidobacteriota bacterium]